MDCGEIASRGYSVEQAANGGWVIISRAGHHEMQHILGAFDDHTSLLSFLTKEHEAHAGRAALDKGRGE